MPFFIVIYTILYYIVIFPGLLIFSLGNRKFREGFLGRLKQKSKIKTITLECKNKEVYLFHSSSVGEWEQSLPIIKLLKKSNPNSVIIATFFSISGIRHAKQTDIDYSLLLPLDNYFTAYTFLQSINPKLWIISKYDVWPAFMYAAHKLNIPVILCSAELAEDSMRYKGISAKINSLFYKYLTRIFTVSEEYKTRFNSIYPFPEKIEVSGDARYDQIIEKAEKIHNEESIQLFKNPKQITFIAGSIWPKDEEHLLPALVRIYDENPNIQMILVPHELHKEHIEDIEKEFNDNAIATDRYSQFHKAGQTLSSVIIVDTIGMLAKLYKDADIAYVGGAFSTGVHNVAEPGVFNNPVIFGPKFINSYEAKIYKEIGAGFCVTDEEECYKIITSLIHNDTLRKDSGDKAHSFIHSNKGASEKIAKYILSNF